jgi:SAM-dependent methyltransferase
MNVEEYAKMFELEDRYWWFVGRRNLCLGLLRRHAPARERLDVLDLGCGTGVVSRELEGLGTVTSLDLSELALGFCRRRGLRRLVRGDGTRLPFREGVFDAVIGLDIFEHIEDDELAFAESFRALRPGGVLVLSVPAFRSLWGPHDLALHHFRRYRRPDLAAKLQGAGFELERLSYSIFFLFPLVVASRLFERLRKGPSRALLPRVPGWLNFVLIRIQAAEARLMGLGSLPWGSSVVAVARKPGAIGDAVD